MHMIPLVHIIYTHYVVRKICMSFSDVGFFGTGAAVVWGYEVYPAQQTQPGPQHRARHRSPCTTTTSEGRASKKAKIVDNESLNGESRDGVENDYSWLSGGLLGAEPILPHVKWHE